MIIEEKGLEELAQQVIIYRECSGHLNALRDAVVSLLSNIAF